MKKLYVLLMLLIASQFVYSQAQVVTTGNNVINTSNPYAADVVIGSDAAGGIRHDASIMWWSSGSASRIWNSGDVFYLSQWSTTNPNVGLAAGVGSPSYFMGNLGIGTTSPAYNFQVEKTSSAPAMMIGGGYAGSPRLQIYGLNADANAWMGLGADMGGGPYEHSVYFPTGPSWGPGKLTFGDYNGSQYNTRMIILQNGNVGVGTTNPAYKLDVNGAFNTSGQSWCSYGNTNMNGYSWTNAALTTNSIEIVNNNGTVNNLSPTLVFHRYGSGGPQFRLAADGSNVLYLESAYANSSRNPNPYGGGQNLYFSRLHIDGGLTTVGNLGIGTTTPNANLQVVGTFLANGNSSNLDSRDLSYLAGTAQMLIGWNRNGGSGETDFISNQGLGSMGGFSFRNYNNAGAENQLMWIRGDGNVAIGTTDPKGYKLAVAGNAIAESMTVKLQSAWGDYVFKPTYKLMPLSDLKTYIDNNQHLPEIPPASQIEKDGLNLGEMNKMLVKKVEELTLYLIEKDTQLSKQENEIAKQNENALSQQEKIKQMEQRLEVLEKNIKNK